jgi:hypothetical protein
MGGKKMGGKKTDGRKEFELEVEVDLSSVVLAVCGQGKCPGSWLITTSGNR